MLMHVVCFKYKTNIAPATRALHRDQLTALQSLDGVIELKVGEDVVRSPRSYDTALVITFPDRAALDAYQKDQQHVPIAQFGASLADHIVAVDFEI
jgi:Stress responsive A/B Barrel Domain